MTLGCLRRDGDPDNVQNDLHTRPFSLAAEGHRLSEDSLVLDVSPPAVARDLPVPRVPLEPAVLHDLHRAPGLVSEPLEHAHVVRVAHADRAHRACVLERDQRAPCCDGVGGARERGVQQEGVEVGCAEVAQGGLHGILDLRGERVGGIVGQRLRAVLSIERGESGPREERC